MEIKALSDGTDTLNLRRFFAAAFLVLAVLIAAALGGAHLAFQHFGDTVSDIADDTLPRLTAALRFSEAAARLAGETPTLSALGRGDNRLAVSVRLDELMLQVETRLAEITDHPEGADYVDTVSKTEDLIAMIGRVRAASARRMELKQVLDRQITELNTHQGTFQSALSFADIALRAEATAATEQDIALLRDLRAVSTEVAGLLLTASLIDELGQLSLMEEDFAHRMAVFDKALFAMNRGDLPVLIPDLELQLSDLGLEIEALARGHGSIFESRRELLALRKDERVVLADARHHADLLAQRVAGLVQALTDRIVRVKDRMDAQRADGTVMLIAVGLAVLALAGLIFLILSRTLIEHEQRLCAAKREAERADAVKGAFLATMSHELQTPLNGVIGLIELMRDTKLDRQQTAYLKTVSESAGSLSGLLRDLLDLSQIDHGHLAIRNAPFAPVDVITSVISLMRPAADAKGLHLSVEVGPDCPLRLDGDAQRMRQVLINLLDNAIKFTSSGHVAVSVHRGTEGFAFKVRDTGIGIPPEQMEKVFGSFVQGEEALDRSFGGAGLGLSISRRLVALMGGDMAVDSRVGSGTVFTVSLPMPVLQPAAVLDTGPSGLGLATSKGREILLIPERGPLADAAAGMLRRGGYGVSLCPVDEAADHVGRLASVDAVVLDTTAEGLDSAAVVWRLRTSLLKQGLPVLALGVPGDKAERFRGVGVLDFVTPPLKQAGLIAALEAALHRTPAKDDEMDQVRAR